jgi:hypothetical protein
MITHAHPFRLSRAAVAAYAVGATGDPAPIATLHGADTGLGGPAGLGFVPGATEQLLIANALAGSVTQYGVPADGDTKPAATPVGRGGVSSPIGVLVIAPPTLTSASYGIAGVAFSQALTAGGGFGPYRWSVASGSLPAGLSLNAATGAITGTPSVASTTTLTVRITDGSLPTAQSATASVTITAPPSSPPYTSPTVPTAR